MGVLPVRLACVALVSALVGAVAGPAAQPATARFDPARYFSTSQLARLKRGEAVIATRDVPRPHLAMIGAVRIDVSADRFVAWMRQLDKLYAGTFAPAGGRVSAPARVEDFASVTLTAKDLDGLRECETGDCRLKLSGAEIAEARRVIQAARDNWKPAATDTFRQVLVRRANAFLAKGQAGLAPYEDHRRLVTPATEFSQLLEGMKDAPVPPGIGEYLRTAPAPRDGVESALFWLKNITSGTREVISLTHVAIHRVPGANDAVAAESQVYCNHYLDASITYLAVVGEGQDRYLLYIRRSSLDVVRGAFAVIIDGIVERRVRSEAPKLITALRKRLDSGDPPAIR